MNANMLSKRAGMLFAAASLVSFVISAAHAVQPQSVAPTAGGVPAQSVVDKTPAAATPIELLLFVHRADLPLRALPIK